MTYLRSSNTTRIHAIALIVRFCLLYSQLGFGSKVSPHSHIGNTIDMNPNEFTKFHVFKSFCVTFQDNEERTYQECQGLGIGHLTEEAGKFVQSKSWIADFCGHHFMQRLCSRYVLVLSLSSVLLKGTSCSHFRVLKVEIADLNGIVESGVTETMAEDTQVII